ncbi:MAG: GH1 family beta-glucosidase [Pseudomonadota bacterium]
MKRSDFPDGFTFGTATSSYQIEGTQFGRCGSNHWDKFAYEGGTANRENGDLACAHFEKWGEDFDLIKEAGFGAYRFSTAWPRIQPEGKGQVFDESLDFYDALVDGLLVRGIEPHLTLYHWDLPLPLAEKGGWTSKETAYRFGDYADIVSRKLGDRLASIATINEPWCVAWLSHYLGHHAPGLTDLSAAAKAMHNILLAHGHGMEAMRASSSISSDCLLGIVLNIEVQHPATDRDEDIFASEIQDGIYNRWFADAVFKGEYPKDILEHLSLHMPEDWQSEMALISQPIDWLGLNYYTRVQVKNDHTDVFPFGGVVAQPSAPNRTSMNWEIYPDGLEYFLKRIHERYDPKIPIMVSENGMASHDRMKDGQVSDTQRVGYFEQHLGAVQNAIANGVPVTGYFAWSLLDNFEWAFGYQERFGIVHVDFETQERTPKASWYWWQELLG